MTVLSRVLIRKMIIQEMRLNSPSRPFKSKISSGLSFDDDQTLDIDDETEIDAIPSFMSGFEDTEIDFDADSDDFGLVIDADSDDFEFESETEEDLDPESETEYNPGRQVMDMSGEEIRRHVTSMADKLSPPGHGLGLDRKTRAEMKYDELVRQGRETEMPDPEFMGSDELGDYDNTAPLKADRKPLRPKLSEQINKRIRQSIRRQLLLL